MNPKSEEEKKAYASRIEEIRDKYSDEIEFYKFCQFVLEKQNEETKKYALSSGIKMIADRQVAFSDRDAWAYQSLFLEGWYLGCPPDYFSKDGQAWGFPVMDPASFGEYPYPEVDVSSWALTGAKQREARSIYSCAREEKKQIQHIYDLHKKFEKIAENETTYEEFNTEDADIILVAFGSMTRNIKAAMNVLRKKGIKAGCFRPVTLSPFPEIMDGKTGR